MSSIGEKIKEALTGHSNKDTSEGKTTDETTPRSYTSDEKKVTEGQTNLSKLGHHHNDNEIGAGHTQGRHDPEVDAKEATSQAGNYPYWGDIPREGEQGHSQQPGTSALGGSHGGDSHNIQKGSGLAAGGLAAGAGTTAASRESEYAHRPLGTQDSTATTQNLTDRTRDSGLTSSTQDPSTSQTSRDGHKGEIAAATGAGLAGATYLGTRHKDEDNKNNYNNNTNTTTSGLASGPTQAGPGSLDPGYASQTSSSTTRPQEVSNSAFGDNRYGTQDNTSHRKEEGALAAGAAGLGGAGYLAHKRHEDQSRTTEQPSTTTGSQQREFPLTSSGNDNPYSTTSGDNSHFGRDAALAGAGAAGLGGAGYLAHKHNEDQTRADERPTTTHTTQQRDSTTGGGIHNTVIGAGSPEDTHSRTHKSAFDSTPLSSSNTTTVGPQYGRGVDPREQQTISSSLGAPNSGNDREKQGLAAAAGVGAGAGVVAAEEKHRHHHDHRQYDDDQTKNQGHSVFGSSGHHHTHDKHNQPTQTGTSTTTSQPSAQLAAQQAWNNNQNQTSTGTARHDPESEARQATSAAGNYPYEGQDRTTSSNVGGQQQHHHNNAALGAAGAGLAGAGATAAYYGQGRQHDQNPRSDESQKIADRALGSDGGAHAPSSTQSQSRGLTGASTTTPSYDQSSSGLSGGSALGSSTVLHKCHQCGADNDISDYFKKDATFRSGA